jgi:hypothetical protein
MNNWMIQIVLNWMNKIKEQKDYNFVVIVKFYFQVKS